MNEIQLKHTAIKINPKKERKKNQAKTYKKNTKKT